MALGSGRLESILVAFVPNVTVVFVIFATIFAIIARYGHAGRLG